MPKEVKIQPLEKVFDKNQIRPKSRSRRFTILRTPRSEAGEDFGIDYISRSRLLNLDVGLAHTYLLPY